MIGVNESCPQETQIFSHPNPSLLKGSY